MGAVFNPFTGTLDFTGSGGGGTTNPAAPDTSVQFNDGGVFGGDADLTWSKTTNRLGFTSGSGLSFAGSSSPITMVGGDAGFGDSAIIFDNPTDSYIVVKYNQFTDIFAPLGWEVFNASGGQISLIDDQFTLAETKQRIGRTYSTGATGEHVLLLAVEGVWNATDGSPTADGLNSINSDLTVGSGAVGTINNSTCSISINGSGNAVNESVNHFVRTSVNIGTGFTQTGGPTGHYWLQELDLSGPIGVRPGVMVGTVVSMQNHFNGSPSGSPIFAHLLATKFGIDGGVIHAAADTYPNDVGLAIAGTSHASGVDGIGWTTAIQIGGSAPVVAGLTTSQIGTGIHIRDHRTAGIAIDNQGLSTAPDITMTGFMEGFEMTAPAAPAANGGRLFFQDNGAGKTQLMVIFATGAAQQLAIQA